MSHRLNILSCAAADMVAAAAWYEELRPGLGDDFLLCIEEAMENIQRNPESFAIAGADFRRSLIRRFPYAVYFRMDKEQIKVYGVFHTSRNPTLWQNR